MKYSAIKRTFNTCKMLVAVTVNGNFSRGPTNTACHQQWSYWRMLIVTAWLQHFLQQRASSLTCCLNHVNYVVFVDNASWYYYRISSVLCTNLHTSLLHLHHGHSCALAILSDCSLLGEPLPHYTLHCLRWQVLNHCDMLLNALQMHLFKQYQ